MIDNLEQIRQLLNFEDKGDFYMLYVFKRKKDQPEGEKDNHQSVRTIKSYCVTSVEYLERRYDEIKQLCEMFKARAYIHVQKQNHKDVSLNMMVALAQRIQDGNHYQQGLFDSVVGQIQRYMGYVQEELAEPGQNVRGVIIALDDDKRIRRALAVAANIEFYRYQIDFKLFKA